MEEKKEELLKGLQQKEGEISEEEMKGVSGGFDFEGVNNDDYRWKLHTISGIKIEKIEKIEKEPRLTCENRAEIRIPELEEMKALRR